ncbi:hypothetical protein FA15DRAFT_740560 [Coprinopsis marcescibilis]|uniref:Nephrocystin 3-like N-terminal domain-containing protein n=1 Tax=Coprinopsis marcescibilis TaxID=230819 RepID=A0A5C3KWS8_COPMA|nr:hypothetical protein FA15DRAFT_740560 [Coprinopsis marcescibilis]
MLKTILASPRDDGRASSARTGIGDATPGSSNTKPSRRLWKSFKGSLRGQGSAKAGVDIFSKSSHVILNDVSINAHAADRLEIHYHNADSATGIKIHEALGRLPDPKRCYWDVMNVCSEGTRTAHLEEISSWATRFVDNNVPSEQAERVLVVGGPAGSGKSALANTICKRMDDSGLLVASFFFRQMGQHHTSESFMAVFIRGLCNIDRQIEQRIGRIIVEKPALASSSAIAQFEGLVIPIIPLLPTDRTFVVGIDALDEQADKVLVAFLRDYVHRLPATFKFVLTTRPVPQVMEHLEGQPHIHIFSRLLTGESSFQDVRTYAQLRLSKTNYHPRVSPKLLDEFISKSEGLFMWAETVLNHIDNSYDPPAELADIVKGASSHWMESETSTKKLESLYAHILSKMPWTDRRFVEKYNVVMGAFVTLMAPLSVRGLAALYAPDGVTEEDIHRICAFIRPLLQDYSRHTPQKPVQLLHLSVQEFLTQNAPAPYHIDSNVHHLFLSRLSLLTIKTELMPTNVPTLGFTEGDWVWDFTELPPGIPRLSKDVVLEHLWYACCHLGQHELSVLKDIADQSRGALLYEIVVENPRYLLEASASMGALIDIVSLRKKTVTLHSVDYTSKNTRMTMKAYFAMACCLYPQEQSLGLMEEAVRLYRQSIPSSPDPSTELEYATGLCRLAQLLYARLRSREGLRIAEEALTITRRLTSTSQNMESPVLGHAILLQIQILHRLDRCEECHELDLKAIDTFRELEAAQPETFRVHLAMALSLAGSILMERRRHSEAITYLEESTKLRRLLVASNPDKHESFMADVLLQRGICFTQVGKATEAVALGEEAVMIRRRLVEKDPSHFSPYLGCSLYILAWCLSECGQQSEAVLIAKECVDIRRRLTEGDPAAHETSLADSLHNYAFYLSNSPITLAESIEQGQKAVEIRRRLACEDPQSFNADLAWSLFNLACNLYKCSRYSEAVPIAKECVDIRRRLTEEDPAAHKVSLASSLHSYALYLSKSPTTLAESIEHGQEAVEIRRCLAREDPQNHDADLAQSLFNLACDLGNCSRYSEAVPIAKECVNIRHRLAEEDPAAHKVSLTSSLHSYALYLSKSPGTTLAESIERGQEAVEIWRRLAREDPQSFEAGLAQSLNNLAGGLVKFSRYSEAVSIMKECVETRRGLTARDCAMYEPLLAGALNNQAWYLAQIPGREPEAVKSAEESVKIFHRLVLEDPKAFSNGLAASLDTMAYSLNHSGRYEDALPPVLEGLEIYHGAIEGQAHEISDHQSSSLHKTYAESLIGLGRNDEASVPLKSAIIIYERLVASQPQKALRYSLELQECRQLSELLAGAS